MVIAVGELGDMAKPVVDVLKQCGAADAKDYEGTRSLYEGMLHFLYFRRASLVICAG